MALMTALVVAADTPIDNASRWSRGRIYDGNVRILIDEGSAPIYVARRFRLDEDHWLVPGMEVPVKIDPERPDEFEIDWAGVPSIEARVAANDPVLADPRGARRRVTEALEAVGVAGPKHLGPLLDGIGDVLARAGEAKRAASPDRFDENLERAAHEPAPPGKMRAVALVSAITASVVQRQPEGGGGSDITTSGKRKTVLAVTVPGSPPYAVLMPKLKHPRMRADVAGSGLPALVSTTDANDVEILWEELPSVLDQVGQRISDSLAASGAQAEELERGMMEQVQEAIAKGPPPMPSVQPTPPAPGMPQQGAAQEMMIQSAKQALRFVQDPAMRKMMIEQYRAAGIEIDDADS
jgi:hypothetical protein